jgi:hypothetical protein
LLLLLLPLPSLSSTACRGAVRDVEVVWVLKHEHIGDAFFDIDAAEFLLGVMQQQQQQQQQVASEPTASVAAAQQHQQLDSQQQQPAQEVEFEPQQQRQPQGRRRAQQQQQAAATADAAQPPAAPVRGHAAGPKWVDALPAGRLPAHVRVERRALVVGASSTPLHSQHSDSRSWPLYLQLDSGDEVGVDLLVTAIGVEPSTDWLPGGQVAHSGLGRPLTSAPVCWASSHDTPCPGAGCAAAATRCPATTTPSRAAARA